MASIQMIDSGFLFFFKKYFLSFYIILKCNKKIKFEGIRKWKPLEIQCLISSKPVLDNENILRGRSLLVKAGWVVNEKNSSPQLEASWTKAHNQSANRKADGRSLEPFTHKTQL